MDPNFTFPQPSISAGANPPSSEGVAAFYLVVNSAQGPTYHSNAPSPRRTPSPQPPPSQLLQPSSHTLNFPMPSVPVIQVAPQHSPGYHLEAPDIPYSLSHSGVSGATQTWTPPAHQRNQDDSSDEEIYEEDEAFRNAGLLSKSPPSRSFFTRTTRPSRKQTLEHPVREPKLDTYPCRFPQCPAAVKSDVAARLGGFCCDTHMLLAIHNGIAMRCSRCKQRVCPEGSKYCSGQCANGPAQGRK
ncbi:hypothetical protein EDB87DRAFT_1654922 [Lactarius vividus]|nr:hypothetical protein EDB87DRAFT_1654922 [Lactarius vividus]